LLLVVCYLLFVIGCLLLVVCYLLFAVCCFLLVIGAASQRGVEGLLVVAHWEQITNNQRLPLYSASF